MILYFRILPLDYQHQLDVPFDICVLLIDIVVEDLFGYLCIKCDSLFKELKLQQELAFLNW